MIKVLNEDYLTDVMTIIKEVIIHMNEQGIDQWDEVYPNIEIITQDLKEKCAYGYFDNDELSGYVAINKTYPPPYDKFKWKVNNGEFLVVHRLMIKPDKQGKGIAKQLMSFAEEFIRGNGYKAIRLDAFSLNPVAISLYEHIGYSKVGSGASRKGGLCYFYEKVL